MDGKAKGFIFRYYADTQRDPYFCDDGIISDPDFFVNRYHGAAIPVWAICGVYHRARLNPGDMVFFLPAKERLEAKGLTYYICTGVLVVGDVLPDNNHLLSDSRFSASYKRAYAKDLRNHLNVDGRRSKPRTKKLRPCNIIVGDQEKSKWYGSNTIDFQKLLVVLGMGEIARLLPQRNNRNLPALSGLQTQRLCRYLNAHLAAITDVAHQHPDGRSLRSCRGCHVR